jgi:uncharacterized protein YciI
MGVTIHGNYRRRAPVAGQHLGYRPEQGTEEPPVSTVPPIRREILVDAEEHTGEPGDTFVVLLHRPGPAAPTLGSLFEDPRFGQHVAFLNRMREGGYLVLAGPLGDAAGEGMTILRLPGAGRFAAATRLATEDDASVAGGFFTVTVRPWQVMMGAD